VTSSDRLALAVIPARGGSRGLPGKHLRRIGGVPLIAHTIRAALEARRVGSVIVSSDDPRIMAAARRHGAEAPFRRPAALSTDEAPTVPAIEHAVRWVEEAGNGAADLVVTLQPTSPLRTAAEIDAAIALLDDPSIDSAVSVASTGLASSVIGVERRGRWQPLAPADRDARRQAVPEAMRLTGGIYVTRRAVLAAGRLIGDACAVLVVDPARAIDIDTEDDLRAARAAWRRDR
jgi:CMP-N-acetylneuraminic acid synthetase